jgi:hypothetical protein
MQRWLRFSVSLMIACFGLIVIGRALVTYAQPDNRRGVVETRSSFSSTPNFPNCRFGVGGGTQAFSVTALNIGWSMDWQTQLNPPHPNGAEYFQVVTIKPAPGGSYVFTPPTATLHAILDQNPGATWLIGNEPDSPAQDKLRPELYAQAYHQLYYLIKQRDASAQVAAGNIVQPTPLRMLYLDRVLSYYQKTYGEWLPADVWSIHSYILREIDNADPEAVPNGSLEVWGAYIPPGITATRGMLYTYSQMFDPAIFRQRLLDFRAWMRNRGYGDKPLYITEFGTLFPYIPYNADDVGPFNFVDENGVEMDEARSTKFMTETFNVLRSLTDTTQGYVPDANRVVQRWLWYSLSDTSFGGPLFDPTTHVRRPLGDVFADYTAAIPPEVDLVAVRVRAESLGVVSSSEPHTVTLKAVVANSGNVSVTSPITVAFYAGQPLTGTLIDSRVITSPLNGCGTIVEVSVAWTDVMMGVYPVYVTVQGTGLVSETTLANNVVTGQVMLVPPRLYLPVILKTYPWTP